MHGWIWKAKTHLELNKVTDVRDNKKGFYKYTCSKRKAGKNGPIVEWSRGLGDKAHEKRQST